MSDVVHRPQLVGNKKANPRNLDNLLCRNFMANTMSRSNSESPIMQVRWLGCAMAVSSSINNCGNVLLVICR